MEIKIIAVDLDGTLLNDDSDVSIENLNAIKKLNEQQIYLVPCTGRTLAEFTDKLKYNDDIRYIIYSNGSVVFDKKNNTTIKNCISNESLNKVLNILSKYKVHLTIRYNGNCYVKKDSTTKKDIDFYNIIPAHVDVVYNYATEIENFNSWLKDLTDVEVVSAFFNDYEEKLKLMKEINEIEELTLVEACKSNVEIISKKATKGSGLKILANLLNVNIENVMAIGDSGNDIPMMSSAGIKIAVSNANDKLKSICNKIICSNNEHAVDYVVKNLIK